MIMKHVLLEVYCDCNFENGEKPLECDMIGYKCFDNKCRYLSFTYCPNEISYAGANGVVESFDDCIGFGGDMGPEIDDIDGNKIPLQEWEDRESMLVQEWESICKKKITEAYEEYMKFKNSKGF